MQKLLIYLCERHAPMLIEGVLETQFTVVNQSEFSVSKHQKRKCLKEKYFRVRPFFYRAYQNWTIRREINFRISLFELLRKQLCHLSDVFLDYLVSSSEVRNGRRSLIYSLIHFEECPLWRWLRWWRNYWCYCSTSIRWLEWKTFKLSASITSSLFKGGFDKGVTNAVIDTYASSHTNQSTCLIGSFLSLLAS